MLARQHTTVTLKGSLNSNYLGKDTFGMLKFSLLTRGYLCYMVAVSF